MSTKGWTENEKLNWDEVPDGPPPPPEDGLYRFKIAKAEAKLTSSSNKPSVKITVELTARFGGDELKRKSKFYETLTFSAEAAFKPKSVAKSVGVSLPPSTSLDDLEAFADSLVGGAGCVKVRTSDDTYNGQTTKRINAVFLTEDEAAKVAAGGEETTAGDEAGTQQQRRRRR